MNKFHNVFAAHEKNHIDHKIGGWNWFFEIAYEILLLLLVHFFILHSSSLLLCLRCRWTWKGSSILFQRSLYAHELYMCVWVIQFYSSKLQVTSAKVLKLHFENINWTSDHRKKKKRKQLENDYNDCYE